MHPKCNHPSASRLLRSAATVRLRLASLARTDTGVWKRRLRFFQTTAERARSTVPPMMPMQARLDAMLAAVRTERPATDKFYSSLSDEQRARFNALRPSAATESASGLMARRDQARNHSRCDIGRLGSFRAGPGLGRSQQEPTGIQAERSSATKGPEVPPGVDLAISAVFGMATIYRRQAVAAADEIRRPVLYWRELQVLRYMISTRSVG
jgi:hypothetical protein